MGEMGFLWEKFVSSESESIIIQTLSGLGPGPEQLEVVPDSSFRGASGGHFKVSMTSRCQLLVRKRGLNGVGTRQNRGQTRKDDFGTAFCSLKSGSSVICYSK